MSPTATILQDAGRTIDIIDAYGRRITVRRLNVLDRLRLFKAAGPELSRNETWLGLAMLACSVSAIDDVPMPAPVNELQIEAAVSRLGEVGIAAAAEALTPQAQATAEEVAVSAGN